MVKFLSYLLILVRRYKLKMISAYILKIWDPEIGFRETMQMNRSKNKLFSIFLTISRILHEVKNLVVYNSIIQFTLRSQIEGYTRLLIFRKFSTLPAVIWASQFINFQENFHSPCFSPTQMKNFTASPLLLESTRLLNLKKNSSLPFY